jgi:hypothetical protein
MTDSKIEFRGESESIRVEEIGDTYWVFTDVSTPIFRKLHALRGMKYSRGRPDARGRFYIHKKFGPSLSKLIGEICDNEKTERKAFDDEWERLSRDNEAARRLYQAGIRVKTAAGGYILLDLPCLPDTRMYLGRVKGCGDMQFMKTSRSWRIERPATEDLLPVLGVIIDTLETKNLDMSESGYAVDNLKLRVPLDIEVRLFAREAVSSKAPTTELKDSRVSDKCRSFDVPRHYLYMAFFRSANAARVVVLHVGERNVFGPQHVVLLDAPLDAPLETLGSSEFNPFLFVKLDYSYNSEKASPFSAHLKTAQEVATASLVTAPAVSSS